jgi:hypothetical protein
MFAMILIICVMIFEKSLMGSAFFSEIYVNPKSKTIKNEFLEPT